jgi:hypothetical protein
MLATLAVALDAKYAPRMLDADHQLALSQALAKHKPPTRPIEIHSVSGDGESAQFGQHLEDVIRAAGWPAHHENMAFFGAPSGLQVRFEGMVQTVVEVRETHEAACPACFVLARALARAGFPAKVMMSPRTNVGEPPSPRIELVVGYKPAKKP